METLKLDIAKAGVAITADIEAKAQAANALLHSGKGAGNDFLGWVKLPSSISDADIAAIEKEAAKLRAKADVVICIGIGGSYLGAKAVLEAMSDPFKLLHKEQKHPTVLFAGQNISEDYTAELLDAVKEHSIAAIVISKSGTTTEPAIAFRPDQGRDRKALRQAGGRPAHRGHHRQGPRSAEDPRHAGGLSDVRHSRRRGRTFLGADPRGTAAAGRRRRGHRGARARRAGDGEGHGRRRAFQREPRGRLRRRAQPALRRAARRSRSWARTSPSCSTFNEWWKQLYGESEGKQGKGIFPASVTLTADLPLDGPVHSGRRAHALRDDHLGGQTRRQGRHRSRRRKPRRAELPGRKAHLGGQPHRPTGRAAGAHRRRRAEHPHRDSRDLHPDDRRPALLLRERPAASAATSWA